MPKELNELKELIMVVDQNHDDVAQLLGNTVKGVGSKLGKLYRGIAEGAYGSDEMAAEQLYPGEPLGSSYRKLKSKLREKLIAALSELDLKSKESNEYQKAYYECNKLWAATKILLGKNANTAASVLSLKIFKQAERFEFTAMAMDMAASLRVHYALREGDVVKYLFFSERFEFYQRLLALEAKAEQFYLDSIISQVNSKELKHDALSILETASGQISALLQEGRSYRVCLYAALVQLSFFMAKKDYAAAIQICNTYIEYFKRKDFEAHVPLQILFYQKLVCSFNLKEFSSAEESLLVCKQYLRVGTYNWFKYRELLVQMALYNQDYSAAWDLYHQTTKNPQFALLPDNITEVWVVIRAHLHFLNITNAGGLSTKKIPVKSFRPKRMDNETILYARDKRGLNIAILIIQFLILLAENKRSEALDQVEALDQYAYRHLRKAEHQRSRLFIRMLLQVPLSSFNVPAFMEKNEPLLQKLRLNLSQDNSQLTEIEIIPYEHAWEILCHFFQKKHETPSLSTSSYSQLNGDTLSYRS